MIKKARFSNLVIPFFIALVTGCIVAGVIIFISMTGKPTQPTHKYLLPTGFTGWVEVTYEQPSFPALKKEGSSIINYEVPPSGKIMTSSKNDTGPMEFYYVGQDGRLIEMPNDIPKIHGVRTSSGGESSSSEKFPEKLTFFVGTEEQWREAAVK